MLDNLFGKTFENDSVAVIGLGRFGSAVADSLTSMGHEVLGIDSNSANVQQWGLTGHVTKRHVRKKACSHRPKQQRKRATAVLAITPDSRR